MFTSNSAGWNLLIDTKGVSDGDGIITVLKLPDTVGPEFGLTLKSEKFLFVTFIGIFTPRFISFGC